jgi:plastocyanin
MWKQIIIGILTILLGASAAWGDSPTTMPATQPSGAAITGIVALSGEISLDKPDLTRIVVYLDSDPVLDAVPRTFSHATVAQKDKRFVPNFTIIPKGTPVEFPNWDDFDHNVFSLSAAAPAFDLARYPRGQSKTRVFDKVGVVRIFCNIHPSMRALVVVTPNVFYTRPDAAGNFKLQNVPPGHFNLIAWQERCGQTEQSIDLGPAGASNVTLTLSEDRDQILADQPPTRNVPYGLQRGLGVQQQKLNLPVVKDSHAAIDPEN